MLKNDNHKYDDIIDLPHHVSKKHPQMSMYDRAAQFSSFAALVGHEDAIKETARLTERKIELSDYDKERLNQKLQIIIENINLAIKVKIIYFLQDDKKTGGKYVCYLGEIKKYDDVNHELVLKDETVIPIYDISDIQSEIFKKYNIE